MILPSEPSRHENQDLLVEYGPRTWPQLTKFVGLPTYGLGSHAHVRQGYHALPKLIPARMANGLRESINLDETPRVDFRPLASCRVHYHGELLFFLGLTRP